MRATTAGQATAAAIAAAIGLISVRLLAAEPAASSTMPAAPSPAHEASAPASPAPATLYDIVGELARTEALQRHIEATLRETADWAAMTTTLNATPLAPRYLAVESERDPVTRIRYVELRGLDVPLRERIADVSAVVAGLGRTSQKLVAELDRLDHEAAVWPRRAMRAREAGAPPELQASIDAVGPALAALREQLVARRDEVLVAYQRGVRLQSRLESLRADLAERRERLWNALRTNVGAPIWRPGAAGVPADELVADIRLVRFELAEYLQASGGRIGFFFVALGTALFFLLRRPSAADAAMPRLSVAVAACGALAVTLAATALFAPSPVPFAFYRFVWFFFPLLAALVATHTFARDIAPTVWALAFALFLNDFRALAEMSPAGDWLLLVLQVVPFGIALVRDWRRGALAAFLSHWRAILLRRSVQTLVFVLMVAIVASAFGYAGLALAIVGFAVIAPGYMMNFAALVWTLDHALAGLLSTPLARTLRSVRERRDAIQRTLHRLLVLAAWVGGTAAFAFSYTALDDVLRVAASVANASVTVGDVTITLKAVLAAVAVVALTWLVTKLVRFVLDHELLPRFRLRAGVPVAISTIVGYVLVTTGFILAMAALGIDLTKVTLLAGAVGVGVGFGLQNVVNNFASGLILMLERPVNVGDQIDVGGVVGEVKRIGVRSSTIRTFQGAEVIVPNADLAGKQVTNWTLSDRARRYEIDVGVAYGSDPAQVLKLLESAAASVPEVQKKPAPQALFTGFGASSLDFRLYAWVETVDVGMQAQNGLRIAVLKALEDARIEIPLPQQDLRIRQAPAAALVPLAPRALR